jgi:tRNA uridine 5-carbamoylmethylation protein Kti12
MIKKVKKMKKSIIFTIGPPASGKTTWVNKLCSKGSLLINVNRDDVRNLLTNNQYNAGFYKFDKEKVVTKICDEAIDDFIKNDYDHILVISDTNLNLKILKSQIDKFLQNKNLDIFVKTFFNTPIDELNRRVEERFKAGMGPPIPFDVIQKMYNQIPEVSGYISNLVKKENKVHEL